MKYEFQVRMQQRHHLKAIVRSAAQALPWGAGSAAQALPSGHGGGLLAEGQALPSGHGAGWMASAAFRIRERTAGERASNARRKQVLGRIGGEG